MRLQQITRKQSGRMGAQFNLHLQISTVEVAERAIKTWKDHLISVLAGVDAKFPLHEWDRLIPQATLTLNFLRQTKVSPNVSAYAHHHGQFDYNRMPLVPMGCAVQLREKPKR